MKARAESRNPSFRSSPGGASANGGENLRTASCGIFTGQERRRAGKRTPAFQKFGPEHYTLPPFAKTHQSLDSGSPRALSCKKRRTSKRLRERSKIRSSDNRARSGRNDGPIENPRSRRTPQTESRHSGKEQNPAEKLSAIPRDFRLPTLLPKFQFECSPLRGGRSIGDNVSRLDSDFSR